MPSKKYEIQESPFKGPIQNAVNVILKDSSKLNNKDDRGAVENALYFSVTKRMAERQYGEGQAYLVGLLSDLHQAKYEFSQVCYSNQHADEVFYRLKVLIASLLASEKTEEAG